MLYLQPCRSHCFDTALHSVFGLKTSFWKRGGIPFVFVAILEVIVGFTIVTRSENDIIRVEKFVQNEPQKNQTA